MAKINEFLDIVPKYGDVADFLVIYIQEAHPLDAWHFDFETNKRYSHKCLEDRVEAGHLLRTYIPEVSIVLDNMRNGVCNQYGAKPERLYIIKNGIILYQGAWGPQSYNLKEMESSLKSLANID